MFDTYMSGCSCILSLVCTLFCEWPWFLEDEGSKSVLIWGFYWYQIGILTRWFLSVYKRNLMPLELLKLKVTRFYWWYCCFWKMISSTKNGKKVFHVVGKVLLWIRIAVRYFLGCFCKSACAICLVIVNSGLCFIVF